MSLHGIEFVVEFIRRTLSLPIMIVFWIGQ